jgi:hypothetical protein
MMARDRSGLSGRMQDPMGKRPPDFIVSGDWAFERHACRSTDTDRKTGAVSTDIGKGINIHHHDADGQTPTDNGVWRAMAGVRICPSRARLYSCRRASIGLSAAARRAGK